MILGMKKSATFTLYIIFNVTGPWNPEAQKRWLSAGFHPEYKSP